MQVHSWEGRQCCGAGTQVSSWPAGTRGSCRAQPLGDNPNQKRAWWARVEETWMIAACPAGMCGTTACDMRNAPAGGRGSSAGCSGCTHGSARQAAKPRQLLAPLTAGSRSASRSLDSWHPLFLAHPSGSRPAPRATAPPPPPSSRACGGRRCRRCRGQEGAGGGAQQRDPAGRRDRRAWRQRGQQPVPCFPHAIKQKHTHLLTSTWIAWEPKCFSHARGTNATCRSRKNEQPGSAWALLLGRLQRQQACSCAPKWPTHCPASQPASHPASQPTAPLTSQPASTPPPAAPQCPEPHASSSPPAPRLQKM